MNRVIWKPKSVSITAETLYETLAASPAVVLHFWAVWEGYSRSLDARLAELCPVLAPLVKLYSVDVDIETNWQVCSRYNVLTTPTLLFFVNTNLTERVVGLGSLNQLEDKLRQWQEIARQLS